MDGSKCTLRRDHEATKVWASIKRCRNEDNLLKDSDIFKVVLTFLSNNSTTRDAFPPRSRSAFLPSWNHLLMAFVSWTKP